MEETQPIQLLFNQLSEELKRDQKSEKVRELLREYMEKHEDWKEYCNFSEDWYARNCVNRNSVLELIVICWNHGQKSFCHNHPSSCWLSVLEGEMKETRYIYEDTKTTEGNSRLLEHGISLLQSPDVGYIDDGIALHSLGASGEGKAVSLHIYSPPVTECNIYNIETGEVTKRKMCYYSMNKQILCQKTAK